MPRRNLYNTFYITMMLCLISISHIEKSLRAFAKEDNSQEATKSMYTSQRQYKSLNSAGTTTHHGNANSKSFSQPAAILSPEEEATFLIGDSLFARSWLLAPSSVRRSDGLGPLFNARACQSCHIHDGRGHLPADVQDNATSAVLKLGSLERLPMAKLHQDPNYGFQIQDFTAPTVPMEAGLVVRFAHIPKKIKEESDVILRYPVVYLKNLGYGPLAKDTARSLRIAPPVIGLGLLENISKQDILLRDDPFDRDGDGISGRASWVIAREEDSKFPQTPHLGRFGWKAAKPSLNEQNLAAFSNDMGMNSELHPKPEADCTPLQKRCIAFAKLNKDPLKPRKQDMEKDTKEPSKKLTILTRPKTKEAQSLDVDEELAELILFYTQSLAPPARRIPANKEASIIKGEEIFFQIGCESCHRASYTTGQHVEHKFLWKQNIYPYTDLLLHNMGYELDDGLHTPHASSSEWRTPPLWGLGYTQIVSPEATFLHDGRARTIQEAILWHGGEALKSRQSYQDLTKIQRKHLHNFLNSL